MAHYFFAIGTAALVLASASAADKHAAQGCQTCEKDRKVLGHKPKEKEPQPSCDSKIYPLSDAHYIKQFCGPQICPGACFGYFPNTWRSWDAACGTPTQAVTSVSTPPAQTAPAPGKAPANPMPMPMTPPPGSTDKLPGETAAPKTDKRDQSPVSVPRIDVPAVLMLGNETKR